MELMSNPKNFWQQNNSKRGNLTVILSNQNFEIVRVAHKFSQTYERKCCEMHSMQFSLLAENDVFTRLIKTAIKTVLRSDNKPIYG